MGRSSRHFLIFFVGVMVVMAGLVTWITVRDYDQHFYYETTHDEQPQHEGELGYYENLPPRQQEIVDGALAGTDYVLPGDASVPPPVVKKEGKYHEFASFTSFDWTDPQMFLSTMAVLVGFLISLEGIRREQFPHTDLADVAYHMPFIGRK